MTANVPAKQAPVVQISGRVSSVDWYPRTKPTRFTTLVRLPAADEYSTPATVEVVSDHSIGKEGETVQLTCAVGGRFRSYQVEDKQTGEQRTVRTADNTLTVL